MNKIACFLVWFLIFSISLFAQSKGPLKGKYNETSGTIYVNSEQPKCWLYKLPQHMTYEDLAVELYEYFENEMPLGTRRGWSIDWNDIEEINLKPEILNTIKLMMTRLKRDVAMFLIGYENSSTKPPPSAAYINYYNSSTGVFITIKVGFWL